MTLPRLKWRRLATLTALLVVTTGMAAAPLRSAVAPFITNPLGAWSFGGAEKAAATGSAGDTASVPAWRAHEIELAYSAVPHYLDYKVVSESAGLFTLRREVEHGGKAGGGGDSSGNGRWKLGNARGWRSFGWGRWSSAAYLSGGRSGFGGAGSIGASRNEGREGRNGRGRGIFNEHRGGLGHLTGGKNGNNGQGGGGSVGGGTNLASSPEPSTLLLFGTGLATAAGAIRRRLRRR
jgi:hypothetical protein